MAAVKKGVTPFDADKTFAILKTNKDGASSSTDTSHGEIELITVPTATTKGLARIKVTKDGGTNVEGSMEVSYCKI